MRQVALLVLSVGLLLAAGCSDDDTSTGLGGSGGTPSGTTSTGTTTGVGGSGTGTGTGTAMGGAPPCTAETLADSVRITNVTIDEASSSQAITAQAGSASVVAWAASDGIHVTPLDVVDERAGADSVVEGMQVYGAAANTDRVALLVSRTPDFMTFVLLDHAGSTLATVDFVGGGDHSQEGVEWFGEFARTARLVGRDDGTYAAYHALHRRWPDGIGHQGDTLRLVDAQGNETAGGWGWGCSHSLDQRLDSGPTGLVPICISDCFPDKGIFFNHDDALITADPGANCQGGYNTALGGLAAVTDGFFLVYQDAQAGAHLGHFDGSGQELSDRALSVAGSSRLARYGEGLLLGTGSGSESSVQLLDATGQDVDAPATVSAALPDQDFESRTEGEVAWATASGTTLTVVRVRLCDPP